MNIAFSSPPNPVSPPARVAEVAAGPRTLDALELLAGAPEVLIRLDDALYRLRLTRNGRLILTK